MIPHNHNNDNNNHNFPILFFIKEEERHVRANDRDYNEKFNYAVSYFPFDV